MEWAHERFASVAVTLLPLLLDAAIKGATLLVITAAVAFAMRRASAAARHLVWFLAIAALLFMPLFSATLPGWHILPNWIQPSTAPRRGAAAGFPPAPTPATAADSATIDSPPPYLGRSIPQNSHPLPIIPPPTWKPPPAPSSPTLVSPAPPSIPPTVPLPAAQPQSLNPLTWQTRILLAWLTGTVLYAGYILAGSLSLYRLSRRSSPLTDPDWSTLLSQACQALAFHRPIKLITHPRRSMPMTWGFWRAWILIPQDAEDWTADQRRAVLLHELAHARRWDCLTQLITQLALACYWFNPLAWLAWKAIQTERERAYDDLVLSTGQRASAYAEQLLHLAADLPALHYPAAIAMARPGRLEQRLVAILDPHRRRRLATKTAALACIVALLSAGIVATLRAQNRAGHPSAAAAPATRPATQPAAEPPPKWLSAPVGRIDASGVRLGDVIDQLSRVSGHEIFVEWDVLAKDKITKDLPVTVALSALPLDQALTRLLDAVGGEHVQLGHEVDKDSIVISTRSDLSDDHTTLCVYDVRAAIKSAATSKNDLAAIVLRVRGIDPLSWRDAGDNVGSISVLDGYLIVTQIPQTQGRIAAALRDVLPPSAPATRPATHPALRDPWGNVGDLHYRLIPPARPISTRDPVTAELEFVNIGKKPLPLEERHFGFFYADIADWQWKEDHDPTTWTAGDPKTGRDTGKPLDHVVPAGARVLLFIHFNEKLPHAGKYQLDCGFVPVPQFFPPRTSALPVPLMVVEPGQKTAPDADPTDYPPAASCPAVDHIRARLSPYGNADEDTGNLDDLTIDMRNLGDRQMAFDPSLHAVELQIDGKWYHAVSTAQPPIPLLPFGPGYFWTDWASSYLSTDFGLDPTADWRDGDNHSLRLAHGKHTVRLAITLPPMPGSGETPVRLVTNAVERNTTRDFGSAKPMPFINANQPAPNGPLPATDPATPELRGTVIGADGKPAVGLEVILHGPDPSDAKAATEHCDAQGHYAFVNIPAGKYTLSAAPFTVLSVSIEPGKTLVEAFSSVTRFKVTGRVTYHDGKPVADQLVDVLTKSDDGRILFDRWATTGADGRYSVGTPFDKVESVAEAGSFRDPLHDTKASAGPIDLVELGDSPAPPAPPATQPATQSSARPGDPPTTRPGNIAVTAEMLGTHLPVAGAKVSWSADPRLNGSGRTDAAGRVAIAGISDRCRYLIVRISRPGLTPLFLRWEHSPDDPLPPSPTFFMEPGHRVGGIVIDTAGKPIAGATVVVQARKAYPGYPQMIDGLDDGITDATGHWSVDGVPASPDTLSIAAYDVMHLEREYYSAQPYSPQSSLFAGAAKLTLPMATPIDVRVLKTDGTPAGGAKVLFGYEPGVYGNSMPAVTADRQGIAHLGCKPGMGARLSATLPGFVPAQQDIVVAETPMRLTLQLAVGTRRTIDVVDSDGKPISGAGIDVRNWRGGGFPLWVHLQADRAGHAVWNDAPADDVTVTAYATGYSQRDDLPWSATQPTRIVLSKPATLTARVVDADTGKPIGGFTLRLGAVWHQGDRLVWQPTENLRDTKKVPGGFSLELPRSAYRYLLRVGADGYLPADSELLALDGHDKPLDFRLKPGVDVAGITSSADGKPVANTKVCLVTEGDWLLLNNGDVPRDSHDPAVLALSGATGRFAFPPQKDDFALVAISDYGSAALMRSEFAGGGASLKLSPWASVNGTITIAGKPAANLDVMGESEPIALADGTQLMARQYQFTTDENGNFEVPRVFPGKLKLFREVPNFAPMRFRNFTLLTLDAKPGEHYHVALGQGAAVTGSLAIPPGNPWMVRIARLDRKSAPADADLENVDVSADGHFRAEGIAPGDYTLHVALHQFPPGDACGWGRLVAQFDRDITVPPLPAGGKSVDAGTIAPTALPGPMLKVGDPAPDFTVKTLAGKTLRLSDLRGKVVLLDFWATWCAPCVAELPNLKQIADSNGGPKSGLVILSLSLDDDSQPLQRLIRYYGLTWPQARVGIDGDVVKAYGATAIPATFLIGGDGKILARDLRGDAINDAVRAALAQKQ